MKKVCLLLLTLCAGAFAQSDTVVRWRGMEGVVTAPGVDNPVGQIHSAPGPWTTRNGNARVNLQLVAAPSRSRDWSLTAQTSAGLPVRSPLSSARWYAT